ncbi:MAG: RNA polymerase sigma factor [Planctomycetota bacterium]
MQRRKAEKILNGWLQRHRGLLISVARAFAQSLHDQDDLFQEIVFQVWNSVEGYRSEIAESTWIYRVAFYTAINWSRKEKTRKNRINAVAVQHAPELHESSARDPRVEWLYERISELDSVDRSLTLLLLEGFSYREMSETLGISESNVGVRINRVKKRLTQQLAAEHANEL